MFLLQNIVKLNHVLKRSGGVYYSNIHRVPIVFRVHSKFSIKNFSQQTKTAITNSKKRQGNIQRLIRLAKPEKWKLLGAIGFLVVSSTVTMAVPFALGKVIDIIYTEDNKKTRENLSKVSTILLGVFILGGLCNFARVYLMSVSGQRITRTLRFNVFRSILAQEVAFFDRNKTGELINRLSSDTSLVSQTVTMNISDGLRSLIMTVAGISMMFYTSTELATVGLAIVPPTAVLAVFYARFVRKITKEVQDSLATSTSVAQERIANIRTVKAFGNEKLALLNYKCNIDYVLQLAEKESLARGLFFGMTGLSGNVIVLTVLYYGGVMVTSANLSVGELSSFLLYAAYIGVSVGGLSSFLSELNKGLGASTRLWELMDRQSEISCGTQTLPEPLHGAIEFKDIIFRYPTRPDVKVLHNLSLKIPAGSVTAIVGASGSGKSSIASILLRLYEIDGGTIALDGVPIKNLHFSELHRIIGFVSQEPVLFSNSIRENILYGAVDPEAISEEQLRNVAKECNCFEFIDGFPDGFETVVGERGIMLSGGQKQRIALARALIKNPKILILDEATSALDAESEHLVHEALERIMAGRTVLTIAHRLSTILNADQIAVLENGKIAEIGRYEELLQKEGAFKKLVRHQAFSQ